MCYDKTSINGVATLSPSTSDSTELTSPYSPSDFSSEPSETSSCVSGGSPLSSSSGSPTRDVTSLFLPEVEATSSSSSSSTSFSSNSSTCSSECSPGGRSSEKLSGGSRMTAVSTVLDTQMTTSTSKINVTNFISFQIPKAQRSSGGSRFSNPVVKLLDSPPPKNLKGIDTSNVSSAPTTFHCDVESKISASKRIHNIFAALKYNKKPEEGMPDLTQAEYQPIVKIPNLKGAKSIIIREGQSNKVIILSVPTSPPKTPSSFRGVKASHAPSSTPGSPTPKSSDPLPPNNNSNSFPAKKKLKIYPETIAVPISLATSTLLESVPQLLPEFSPQITKTEPGKKTDDHHHESQAEKTNAAAKSADLANNNNSCNTNKNKQLSLTSIITASTIPSNKSRGRSHQDARRSVFQLSHGADGIKFTSLANAFKDDKSALSMPPFKSAPPFSSPSAIRDKLQGYTISEDVTNLSLDNFSSVDPGSVNSNDISASASLSLLSRKRKLDFNINNFDESDSVSSFSIRSDISESSVSIKSSTSSSTTSDSSRPPSVFSAKVIETNLETNSSSCPPDGSRCLWQDCSTELNSNLNILEHIQNVHVAPQLQEGDGYICLWEGCKVFNKKSCSLSWLERHVLSHGGHKPFKCIFSGCGLSFGSQGALERHVNSHISNNCGTGGANAHGGFANKRIESSPSKAARRKKLKLLRRQRQGFGQRVDYFDKCTMEKIKHRLITTKQLPQADQHDYLFRAEELTWRYSSSEEPKVLVRWSPPNILPDEWIPQSQYKPTKIVPFRHLPASKINLLCPTLFPPERKEKASRKWKPSSSSSSASSLSSSSSTASSSVSSMVSSPPCSLYSASSPSCSIDTDMSASNFGDDDDSSSSDESSALPDWISYLTSAHRGS